MANPDYITKAKSFAPAFNSIEFKIDSTNKNLLNFRYIVDVYSANTAQRIYSQRIMPEIVTGYGVVDLNAILSAQVTKSFFPNANSFTSCTKDYFDYDLSLGEEYVYFWPFFDSLFASSPFAGQTTLSSITSVHFFQSGDTLFVTGGTIPQGVYTVLDTPDAFSVTINAPFVGGPLSGTPGSAVYSDYSNTVFFNLNSTGVTDYTVFNGAVAHQDFPFYTTSAYTLNTVLPDQRKFVTTVPQDFSVMLQNSMWLHYNNASGTTRPNQLIVQTPKGLYSFTNIISGNVDTMQQVACGPYDLLNFNPAVTVISGQTNIFSGVDSYEIWLTRNVLGTDVRVSEKKRFKINDTCFKFPVIDLLFLDRLGSLIPFSFQLVSLKNINITRGQYTKLLPANYNTIDAGKTTIGVVEVEEMQIESNFVSDTDMAFLRELFTSPTVYIKENGNYWPVIMTDSSFPILTKNNKKNFTVKATIQKANNNIINNING